MCETTAHAKRKDGKDGEKEKPEFAQRQEPRKLVRARRAGTGSVREMAALVGEDGEVMACAYVPRSQRGSVPAQDCRD